MGIKQVILTFSKKVLIFLRQGSKVPQAAVQATFVQQQLSLKRINARSVLHARTRVVGG